MPWWRNWVRIGERACRLPFIRNAVGCGQAKADGDGSLPERCGGEKVGQNFPRAFGVRGLAAGLYRLRTPGLREGQLVRPDDGALPLVLSITAIR